MPTMDELHRADMEHEAAIAVLRQRADQVDKLLAQDREHLLKLDESMASLRESMGRVATKDDILDLRRDISSSYTRQLVAANESIPARFAAWTGVAMFILALIGLTIKLVPHG